MKLHLPVTLLRAVMALFATTTTFTSAWAESTVVEPLVITLSENAVYEQWHNPLFENSVEIEEMNWVYADVILTSGTDNKNSVSATFTNSTNPAFFAPYVTLQNLDALSFNNLDSTAIYGHQGISILNNNSVSFINIEYVQDTGASIGGAMDNGDTGDGVVLVQGNGSVSFADNKATVTVGGSAEGAVVRADNVYLRNNGSVSVTGNESYTKDGDCIGGAISAGGGSFDLSYTNGNIDISGNSAVSGSNHRVLGGAILAIDIIEGYDGRISINNNSGEAITIKNNTAQSGAAARTEYGNNETPIYTVAGGALIGMKEVELANNTSSLIEISNNKAIAEGSNDVYGGAIATFGNISIVNNKPSAAAVAEGEIARQGIVFDSNEASSVSGAAYGGAIVSSNDKFAELDPSGNAEEVLPNEVKFADNGDIAFTNNRAVSGVINDDEVRGGKSAYGGAVYSNGDVILGYIDEEGQGRGNGNVEFKDNSVISVGSSAYGGAISGKGMASIVGNVDVSFIGNKAATQHGTYYQFGSAFGGAIYNDGDVVLSDNRTLTFGGVVVVDGVAHSLGNSATSVGGSAHGGAIYSLGCVNIMGNVDGVLFSGNSATSLQFERVESNGSISYTGNSAYGGAIYGYGDVTIEGNTGLVEFTGNTVSTDRSSAYGGAIYGWEDVAIKGNTGGVLFDGNTTNAGIVDAEGNLVVKAYSADGGAIYADGNVDISGNSYVTFQNNEAFSTDGSAWGAGIYSGSEILLSGNGNVTFVNNSSTSVEGYSRGAAIISNNRNGVITIEKNADVLFESNTVDSASDGMSARGGAISTANQLKEEGDTGNFVYLRDNKGSITFRNNASSARDCNAYGGGVYVYGQLIISGNGDSLFVGNSAHSGNNSEVMGGALYSEFGATISGNGDLNFDSNSISSKGGNVSGAAIGAGAGYIIFTGNDNISFTDNSVSAVGSFYKETVEVDADGNETKRQEKVYNQLSSGGAMAANSSVILDENKGDIVFRGNSVTEIATDEVLPFGEYSGRDEDTALLPDLAGGGAIAVAESILLTQNEGNVSFSENMVNTECKSVYGGALAAVGGNIEISGNTGNPETVGSLTLPDGSSLTYGTVNFSQNSVSTTANGCDARGGAIATFTDSYGGGQVLITGNDTVTFYYNSATSKEGAAYGGAIYAKNDVTLSNNMSGVIFEGNSASSSVGIALGGAIYTSGNVTMSGNSTVNFSNNSAISSGTRGSIAGGGAIYAGGDVDISGSVEFNKNDVYSQESAAIYTYGGAIQAQGAINMVAGSVTDTVEFTDNTLHSIYNGMGGAISAAHNSANDVFDSDGKPEMVFGHDVTVSGYESVKFCNNAIEAGTRSRGGAIYADGEITLSDNKNLLFEGNSVTSYGNGSAVGGAISSYLIRSSDVGTATLEVAPINIYIENNTGSITFSNNSATGLEYSTNGGAIYGGKDIYITDNYGEILFEGNKVGTEGKISTADGEIIQKGAGDATGGAIVTMRDLNISKNTGDIIFRGNEVDVHGGNGGGGAICTHEFGNTSIVDNMDVTFEENKVSGYGRYYVEDVAVTGKTLGGGAIASLGQGDVVVISGNGQVTFSGNGVLDETVSEGIDKHLYDEASSVDGTAVTGGGAIMATGNVVIDGNAGVDIKGNYVESGAFLPGQADGRMVAGGAIATYGEVSISHNQGDVNISDNHVGSEAGVAMGGAIFTAGGLSIVNNVGGVNNEGGNVTFSGNYVKNGDTYHLNSVFVAGGNVELAAAKGKSISFYDSVFVGSGSEMVLLNSYTDASGQNQTSTGAIVFSGANAVETLQQLKGEGGTVSEGEISASLTSQINRDVSVAGGSLQVKDGAVLQMVSLGVNKGAELLIGAGSTVGGVDKDITVTFAAGSEYTVQGLKAATTMSTAEAASSTPTAQIIGNVELTAGMTYTMDGAYTELVGDANKLEFVGSGTYTFNVDESVAYTEGSTKYFVLFTGVDTLAGVDPSDLTGIEFLTNIGYYDDIMLHYLNHEKAGGVLYISATVPEPTTATLSLLALAALAARRRRR